MIGIVIPSRNRPVALAETLARLDACALDAPIVVVDNASEDPDAIRSSVDAARSRTCDVSLIELDHNAGAASRTVGARALPANVEWVVMLDDDSAPVDAGVVSVLDRQPRDVGAVSGDIFLSDAAREHGGLPEVWVGCGVAVRRGLYLDLGGYDASFGYYVEEYDLAAKMLLAGRRVVFDPGFAVRHRKVAAQRDMDLICERLVRNNGWVTRRYAPDDELERRLTETTERYRAIAEREGGAAGYTRGRDELERTLALQPRTPMDADLWARFTGLSHARAALGRARAERGFETCAVVCPGKNLWAIRQVLGEMGVEVVASAGDVTVIGTMSPGPMRDAAARHPHAIAPWDSGALGADRVRAA